MCMLPHAWVPACDSSCQPGLKASQMPGVSQHALSLCRAGLTPSPALRASAVPVLQCRRTVKMQQHFTIDTETPGGMCCSIWVAPW